MAGTLVDSIVAATGYSRCIVSALVALSWPVRTALITFLNTSRALLVAEKAKLVGLASYADVVSKQIGVVANAGRAALAPYDTLLGTIPFVQMAENCPLILETFSQMTDAIPVQIPTTAVTSALGMDGFDLFAGVKDYRSMKNKMNELAFRLQRATSVSDKVNKQSADIDRALDVVDQYLAIFSRMQ